MGLEPTWSQTQSPSSASTGLQLQEGQDLHQLVGELFGRHLRKMPWGAIFCESAFSKT